MTTEAPEAVLGEDEIRRLLRECVTVVKPGESLVIRDRNWTPMQVGEIQRWMDCEYESGRISFKVLAVPGDEIAVVQPESDAAFLERLERAWPGDDAPGDEAAGRQLDGAPMTADVAEAGVRSDEDVPVGVICPETWTDEQVTEFQRLWDEHGDEFRHREVRWLPPYPRVARGSVIIEWPAPRSEGRPMPGWDVAVYDAATGAQMLNVMRAILVSAEPSDLVTADLTMLAGEDGDPSAEPCLRDGEVITGTFRFLVAGMRVRQAAPMMQIEPELNAAGATVTSVACPGCGETVPVECRDIGDMTLD